MRTGATALQEPCWSGRMDKMEGLIPAKATANKLMGGATNMLGMLSRATEKTVKKMKLEKPGSKNIDENGFPAHITVNDTWLAPNISHLNSGAFWRTSQTEGLYLCITVKEARDLLLPNMDNKNIHP